MAMQLDAAATANTLTIVHRCREQRGYIMQTFGIPTYVKKMSLSLDGGGAGHVYKTKSK